MNATPFFSLIIPTYNRAGFILGTINSVLAQTFSEFEIIVVDDGSTDNTEELVAAIKDQRLRYYKKKNEERSVARNFGIRQARGKYVTFLDSDDILYPNHFEEAVKMVEKFRTPEIFHICYEVKTVDNKILTRYHHVGSLNQKLIYGNVMSCMGVFVKREIILANQFNEDRNIIGSEDWELWVRLAARYPIHYSNTITSALINHDTRSVLNYKEDALVKRIKTAFESIYKDAEVLDAFGKFKNRVLAHLYLYISLHLLLSKNKKGAFKYWLKAVGVYPLVVFTYKSMVIIWKMVRL